MDFNKVLKTLTEAEKGKFVHTFNLGQAWFTKFKKSHPKLQYETQDDMILIYNHKVHIATYMTKEGVVSTDLTLGDLK